MKLLGVIGAGLLVAGCSSGTDMTLAENGVATFHDQLDAANYDAIWNSAAPGFREGTPKSDYTKFMSAIHTKLGKVKSTDRQGWHVNYGTGGKAVTLSYATEFEKGAGVEQFVYLLEDDKARLFSYNVNSRALIVN